MNTSPNSPPMRADGIVLVGIAAKRPGSGKTTVAQFLVQEYGFSRLPLAAPVKRVCTTVLRELGFSETECCRYLYHDRTIKIPGLDVTGRHLLQTLGTDWGRNLISPSIWREAWMKQFMSAAGPFAPRIVVDDVRLLDEALMIASLGGSMWMIDRPISRRRAIKEWSNRFSPGSLVRSPGRLLPWNLFRSSHPTEGQLNRYPGFDARIVNDATVSRLIQQAGLEAQRLGLSPLQGRSRARLQEHRTGGSVVELRPNPQEPA